MWPACAPGTSKILDRKSGPKKRTKPDDQSERTRSAPNGIHSFLNVNPELQFEIVRGLASPVRVRILRLLRRRGPLNVNQIGEALGLPQSTIATNIQILEESELIDTGIGRARKGQQKICAARFDEIVIRLDGEETSRQQIQVSQQCKSPECPDRGARIRP
jgi:DNA-binding transcriptional ArsR family regulator